MARIVFLNRFFYPDHSATSQMLGDLAFHLAAQGREVHVVTSRQRYDDADAMLPEAETIGGVTIRRVATTRFGRSTLLGRGLDYVSYYRAVARALADIAGAGDVIVAKTDPPLLSIVAMRAAARSGARLVNWLQDLYPEVAVALNVPLMQGPLAGVMKRRRDASLRFAAVNVVISQAMAARLRQLGVAEDRIAVVPNWADDELIAPVSHADNPLRRQWGLQDKFVVGHSGNLGRAHDFEAVLSAAERLRDHPRIVFVFIGGGWQFGALERRVAERRLEKTVLLFPYQDRAMLKQSLAVADLHWLSLRPELEGLLFPSKFYGIAAAGRPMVALTATDGEIAGLIDRHGCGYAVDPGDGNRLTAVIEELAGDPERCAVLGGRARIMLDAHFTRKAALAHWDRVFDGLFG